MKSAYSMKNLIVGCLAFFGLGQATAQDWPQWRGPDRNNKLTGFVEPKAWPKSLQEKWKVKVGLGDSSPVLYADKVYAFGRIGSEEVITCVNAGDGKEIWSKKYAAKSVTGPGAGHPGPRSSPTAGSDKVCTLGVDGNLSCYDAATGNLAWRKETKRYPRQFTATSPMIEGKLCIVHLGDTEKGELIAFELDTGNEKWKWAGDPPSYSSPVIATAAGVKQVVDMTDRSMVGIDFESGKLLWKVPFSASRYNTCTPWVDGDTIFYAGDGKGTIAAKIEKDGDKFTLKQLWKNPQAPGNYNTPLLKGDLIFGLTARGRGPGYFYCMSAKTGDVLWTDTTARGECGAILDAGSVLLALTSDSNLVVFKPSDKEFVEVAKIKVADSPTWGIPIVAGNRIYVKDRDSLSLLMIQ